MKKIIQILVGIIAFTGFANAQTPVFLETFGTTKSSRDGCTTVTTPGTAEAGKYDPQKNELYTDHDWNDSTHVWNDGINYSQTSEIITQLACDSSRTSLNIRTNNPSSYIGASANGNLYFNANVNNSFTISGINTLNYTGVTLSFGIYGKNKSDVKYLKLQYNSGSGLTDLGTAEIAALSTTKGTWLTVSGVSLPSVSSLSLTFSSPNLNGTAPIEIRIDDIKVTGTLTVSGIHTQNENNHKVYVSANKLIFEGFTDENVEIYNSTGQHVVSVNTKNFSQPILPNGLYIIKAKDFTQKISL